jgi:hypothetical protein
MANGAIPSETKNIVVVVVVVVVMVAYKGAASVRIPFCCFYVAIQPHCGVSPAFFFFAFGVLLSAVLPFNFFYPPHSSLLHGIVDTAPYADLSVSYQVVSFLV